MDGTVSRCLKLAASLFVINSHDTLVDQMQGNIAVSQFMDDPLQNALTSTAQRERRQTSDVANARDEAERRRHPIEFRVDANPDGPPLAWVLLWGGVYANIYGQYTPASVRNWGYIMWDERRWIQPRLQDAVVKQWETEPDLADDIERDYHWSPLERWYDCNAFPS